MFIGRGAARRRSVARTGLETARRDQVAAGFFVGFFAGFFDAGLRALLATGLRATRLMLVGASAAALRSGSALNCARHPGESCYLLRSMQALTRPTSRSSALPSPDRSLVQC